MIYIEYVLFLNAVIHILFVYLTAMVVNAKVRRKCLFFSIVIDILYMVLYINIYYVLYLRYIFGVILCFINFYNNNFVLLIKSIFIYNLLNFLLGGVSTILYLSDKLSSLYIIIFAFVIFICSYIYKYISRNNYHINSLIYNILIIYNNKKYFLKGYCDTGNFLLSDDLKQVVFINYKYKIGDFKTKIISKSIGVSNIVDLYEVDEFYIMINNKYIKKNVYIAYSNILYDVMFGVSLLGG